MQLDFLARQPYYVDHLAPIWNALPSISRGQFFALGNATQEYAARKLQNPKISDYIDEGACGSNPILCAAYGDAVRAADYDPGRVVILMEHGVGLTFGKAAYADGLGQRGKFSLIPIQSQYVLNKVHPELRSIPHPVVGIPKLDKWAQAFQTSYLMPKHPTIAFAFHHGDKNSRPAEIGSAWEHYADLFPVLPKQYRWIFHSHPISSKGLLDAYTQWGLEQVSDFEDVMQQADILINDCGSASFEFCATGKPVILLNAPWFDRKSQWGLRFWDYADIGIQINDPSQLEQAVARTVASPDEFRQARARMVRDLFPYLGSSSAKMIEAIQSFLEKSRPAGKGIVASVKPKPVQPVRKPFALRQPIRTNAKEGIVYMCFGEAAKREFENSVCSLRSTGSTLPVTVVTNDVDCIPQGEQGAQVVLPWTGESPFDSGKSENFQFRAGRVKPFLHRLSPYEKTMYVDCDVEFLMAPDEAFGFLKNWDFVIAQERLALSQLYNRPGAGWQHDIEERDYTISHFGGGNGDFPFWNSGVFFWRKNRLSSELFSLWYKEWMVFQGWDEQKALMRAGNASKARILVLSEIWNFPHREEMREKVHEQARIILHEYGRGAARTNVKEQS